MRLRFGDDRSNLMSKAWQAQRERSTPLALMTIRWIALHLGRTAARSVLYPITLYFLLFAPAQRRASLSFLKRVLKRKPTYLDAARHIHCFASTILDRVYLLTGRFHYLSVQFPNKNIPLEYFKKGQGCILLGSHLGSFEVLRSYAVRKCPLPLKILMYEGHNPMIVQILNALNEDTADMVIPMGREDSLLRVKEFVDSGYAVGMLGDRLFSNDKSARCTLLGDEAEIPTAPFHIASVLDVPVIVFFGLYMGGNRYEIHFELLTEHIDLSRKNRQQELQQWAQRYADILEKYVRYAPYNWFNFYDYWQEEHDERATKRSLHVRNERHQTEKRSAP